LVCVAVGVFEEIERLSIPFVEDPSVFWLYVAIPVEEELFALFRS
jgi:hypothetical protein